MFDKFKGHENDPIEALFTRIERDSNDTKLDLGIGVYRDETGQVPVMQSVRQAEMALVTEDRPKAYLTPLGNVDYCEVVNQLVLGSEHPVIQSKQLRSAQTAGAGAALRIGADLIHSISPQSRVWVSDPVWSHQVDFFRKAGLEIRQYRYYDQLASKLTFDEMLEDLQDMRREDVLLLHGCSHNPTGADPEIEQWSAIADLLEEKGAVPFIDVAYQGFGAGIEEDVEGTRLLAERLPCVILAVSSSKSFTIYRDRAGLLSLLHRDESIDLDGMQRQLRDLIRQLYFMPPDHGAAVVDRILRSPHLHQLWRGEIDHIRARIQSLREMFAFTLECEIPELDVGFIRQQKGMFSCLPITPDQQQQMETEHGIYMLPYARLNFAALAKPELAERVANALAQVKRG